LEELVVNNNSIVVAGTYGKTSVTAMLVRIFEKAGKHVSYMYGALPVDGRSSVKFKDYNTNFSVVEGDEYIASRWDPKSKFFYFHPDYLVLNAIQWDHTDVFKTEREYIQNFEKLVQEVPQSGIIFANVGDANVRKVVKGAKCKVVDFDVEMLNAWGVENSIKTDLVGKFNRINLYLACFIAEKLNVPLKVSKKAVSKYKGIKRRLEIKYDKKGFVVVDDFASSAPKVNGSLESVQDSFPNHKIVAIFEPNVGNRTESALKTFKSVFSSADLVLLPKFSEIVKSNNYPMKNTTLAEFLSNNGVSSKSFESDNELIDAAFEFGESHKQVVFVFLSSHGMETRIDALINAVKHRK